ncbi:hypothetical protein [Helicobacter pylori]|nr:hypothetical protein [Helicobacter pylori]
MAKIIQYSILKTNKYKLLVIFVTIADRTHLSQTLKASRISA